MATWTEALYERVLAHVPPPELYASWNSVVQRDLKALHEEVEGVADSFAKVEEVRDAVSKLQQAPVGHSASLLEALNSTVVVQRELQIKLDKLNASTERKRSNDKRKRDDSPVVAAREEGQIHAGKVARVAVGNSSTSFESSPSESESSESETRSDSLSEDEGDADDLEAAWKEATKEEKSNLTNEGVTEPTIPTVETPFQELPLWYVTALESKASSKPEEFYVEVLFTLREWINAQKNEAQLIKVVKCVRAVVRWSTDESIRQARQNRRYHAYSSVLSALKTYKTRLPSSPQEKELDELVDELATSLSKITPTHISWFPRLAKTFDLMSPKNRSKHLPGIVATFINETHTKITEESQSMLHDYNTVKKWPEAGPIDPEMLRLYQVLVNAMQKFAERSPDDYVKLALLGITEQMRQIVWKTPSKRLEELVQDIRGRVRGLAREIKLGRKKATESEIKAGMDKIEALLSFETPAWKPRENQSIRQRIGILKKNVGTLESDKKRKKCLDRIHSWDVRECI